MKKAITSEIKRGQSLSFRVPSDTPDHILKHLQLLKETEKRNFSSKIAEFVMQGVGNSRSRERETITIPLPKSLSKAQRDWLKHEHSEALLGSIVYQLITDPVRATALLASLNSQSSDINQVLYLQEDPQLKNDPLSSVETIHKEAAAAQEDSLDVAEMEDDLNDFDWETALKERELDEEEESTPDAAGDLDELLGDFLAHMNK